MSQYYCNECGKDISTEVYDYSVDNFDRPLCRYCQDGDEFERRPSTRKNKATPHAKKLYKALKKNGIKCILEYDDGEKSVDIGIPWADLYIEVDGGHHFFDERQIETDMLRDEYSAMEGIRTLRIGNDEVEDNLLEVANWITKVARRRNSRNY